MDLLNSIFAFRLFYHFGVVIKIRVNLIFLRKPTWFHWLSAPFLVFLYWRYLLIVCIRSWSLHFFKFLALKAIGGRSYQNLFVFSLQRVFVFHHLIVFFLLWINSFLLWIIYLIYRFGWGPALDTEVCLDYAFWGLIHFIF